MKKYRDREVRLESRPASADNGASIEEVLTSIVDNIGEQNEQMSLRLSELESIPRRERACGKRSTAIDKKSTGAKNA